MNNRLDNELAVLCASKNLSLDALQEKINILGPRLSSQNPSCFHNACRNKKVTLKIAQLLHNTLPGALRLRDYDGWLPIHHLCDNCDLDERNSLDILRFMLSIDHTLPREVNDGGYIPLHNAVAYKSITFCKILIDKYPESLRIESGGWLPIHKACAWGKRDDTADTIQHMLELDPELINADNRSGYMRGYLPIHCASVNRRTESIELLLHYDPDAASRIIGGWERLPLHVACNNDTNLSSIQVLYDAYPEAILARNSGGRTPLDRARSNMNQSAIEFLQTQLVYARQSQDMTAMTTPDENGQLLLLVH